MVEEEEEEEEEAEKEGAEVGGAVEEPMKGGEGPAIEAGVVEVVAEEENEGMVAAVVAEERGANG